MSSLLKDPRLSFVLLCLAWGSTWLAIKLGVGHAPPLTFAGSRFLAASLIMLGILGLQRAPMGIARRDLWDFVVMGVTVIGVTFGLIFWGEQYIDSGIAGVIVQGVVPLGLYGFAVLFRREASTGRRWLGIVVGILGVSILFRPGTTGAVDERAAVGMAAVVLGTIVYCWGSVRCHRIVSLYSPLRLAAWENLIGGIALLSLGLVVEGPRRVFSSDVLQATPSWVFLVVVGSVIGFTAYMAVLKAWGPAKASAYAFITPIIALGLGIVVNNEAVRTSDFVGAAVILMGLAILRGAPNRVVSSERPEGTLAEDPSGDTGIAISTDQAAT